MSISNNATGEVICEQRPTYGGNSPADPHSKYRKGTSRKLDRFEEQGYIAVPPCLWGSVEHGLDPPPNLDGVTLRIVKTSNATYGHHGEVRHAVSLGTPCIAASFVSTRVPCPPLRHSQRVHGVLFGTRRWRTGNSIMRREDSASDRIDRAGAGLR